MAASLASSASGQYQIKEWSGAQGGYTVYPRDKLVVASADGTYKFQATDGSALAEIYTIYVEDTPSRVKITIARDPNEGDGLGGDGGGEGEGEGEGEGDGDGDGNGDGGMMMMNAGGGAAGQAAALAAQLRASVSAERLDTLIDAVTALAANPPEGSVVEWDLVLGELLE
ncbi:MAG: hypothetical protein IPM13_11580 [Phycisphaerales bacterium]|nr:hypothetical protein [Phycisphaerales bacterium]